jgi:hypothetical protein
MTESARQPGSRVTATLQVNALRRADVCGAGCAQIVAIRLIISSVALCLTVKSNGNIQQFFFAWVNIHS